MTRPTTTERPDSSLTRDVIHAVRFYLGSWRGMLILAAIVIVAGVALNWNWLVATGIAPILLTALPCAVMCGLGLCMNRLFGNSSESRPSQPQSTVEPTGNISAPANVAATSKGPSACCHEQAPESTPADLNQSQALKERRSSDA
jgi:hypothetical protein